MKRSTLFYGFRCETLSYIIFIAYVTFKGAFSHLALPEVRNEFLNAHDC